MKHIVLCVAIVYSLVYPYALAAGQQAEPDASASVIRIASEKDFVQWVGTLGIGIDETGGRAIFTHLLPKIPVRMRFTGIPLEVSVAYLNRFGSRSVFHAVVLSRSVMNVAYNSSIVRDGRTTAVFSLELFLYACSQAQLDAFVQAAKTSASIDVVGTVSVADPAMAKPYGRAPFENAYHAVFTLTPEKITVENAK